MSDLIYLLVTVAFFAAAAGFVKVCDRIVGRAEPASGTGTVPSGSASVPVPALTAEEA